MLITKWTKSETENQCKKNEKESETALFLIHLQIFHISIVDNMKEGEKKKVNTLTMYLSLNRPITPDYEVKNDQRDEYTEEKRKENQKLEEKSWKK